MSDCGSPPIDENGRSGRTDVYDTPEPGSDPGGSIADGVMLGPAAYPHNHHRG